MTDTIINYAALEGEDDIAKYYERYEGLKNMDIGGYKGVRITDDKITLFLTGDDEEVPIQRITMTRKNLAKMGYSLTILSKSIEDTM